MSYHIVHWKKKKNAQLKVMFYLVDIWGLWAQGTASQITEGNCFKESRKEARICRSFCNRRPGIQNIKWLLLIKEKRYLKLRNWALFYLWEDARESRLTEIIPLICTSAIWGQHRVLSNPESPGAHCRRWLQQLAARWWPPCMYPELPQVSLLGHL